MHLGHVEICKIGFIVFTFILLWASSLLNPLFLFILRYRGIYLGQDVAVKILRSEHLNDALEDEFAQEVEILR